jgi:hypothetical protein
MPKANLVEKFERRLVELGCPPKRIKRSVQELADHYEDLKQAAREEGFTGAKVEDRAATLLGEPVSLAERTLEGLRQSSWWGRHRVIGFCILPPLCFAPAWLFCVLVCGFFYWLMELAVGPSAEVWTLGMMAHIGKSEMLLSMLNPALNGGLIAVFAIFFCWLAQQSAAGLKWGLIACATSAIHSVFFHITVAAHMVAIGYSWRPNWACALSVLLVAAGFTLRQMRRQARLIATLPIALLVVVICSGCATNHEKPVSQRGWIGGEYKLARKAGFITALCPSPAVSGGLPKGLETKQKSAVLITSLRTHSPVRTAGLQKGDLILELNHKPVTRLHDFRKVVDRCVPGTLLPVKAYRDGQTLDLEVPVGRESFRPGGSFSIVFPSVVHGWDLWLSPGVSLVFVGWEPNPGLRRELGSSREIFEEDWKVFAGIFELSSGKRITAQQN